MSNTESTPYNISFDYDETAVWLLLKRINSCVCNFMYVCMYVVCMVSSPSDVQGMTLNCIHIFIVTGSFL